MAVLVTGVAGFIGFHAAQRLLARGEDIIGIDNLNTYYSVELKRDRLRELDRRHGRAFRFLPCDFAENEALISALKPYAITGVVHLGAQAGVRHARLHPFDYIRSNLLGHANILEFCRHSSTCRHLVYASSSSVYGSSEMPENGFEVEQRIDHPRSLYAATKKSDELMSEAYSYLYRLPQTGLRFFTVYGPWGRPDMAMWLFTSAILAGRPITVFNDGNMRRDFTYIDDIVSGIVACVDNPPPDDGAVKAGGSVSPHRLYNIGNHRSEDLSYMISLLERCLGRKSIREFVPMQPDDIQNTYADIGAIQKDLGYAPAISIEDGIPKFVDWYKTYHGL